jgi:ferredoxin, 2Fe-2S
MEVYALPKVMFLPASVTVEFDSGSLPYHEHGLRESILDVALHFGVPLEHACGGNCACTTCHVIVKRGDSNLSEMEECEEDRLDMAPGLTLHSRLGCRAVVQGDVVLHIPEWNRNYVSEGSVNPRVVGKQR